MCIADEFDKEDYSGNWKWQRKTEYPVAYDFKTICFSASNLLINAKSVCCLCLLKLIIKTLKCVSIIREIRIRTNFLVHKKMDPSCVKTVTMIMKKMI